MTVLEGPRALREASVNITAQAEVVIHWPRTGVSSNNVQEWMELGRSSCQVEFISHQIWPPLPPKPEPGPFVHLSHLSWTLAA